MQVSATELKERIKKNVARFSVAVFMLRMAASNEKLRLRLLAFVDVLPDLYNLKDVREHFLLYISPFGKQLPFAFKLTVYAMQIPVISLVTAWVVRFSISNLLAPYFIVKNEKKLKKIEKKYSKQGANLILDFLGELVTGKKEAEQFKEMYINAIKKSSKRFLVDLEEGRDKHKGEVFHIAVKLSALYENFDPHNYEEAKRATSESFAQILREAKLANCFVTVDAEHYQYLALVQDIFCEVISRDEFANMQNVGIALQAYLKDSLQQAERLVDVAQKRGTPFMVRLVKGAYWDFEHAEAEQKNWQVPVFSYKVATDRNYEKVFAYLMKNWNTVYVSCASHNPQTIAFAIKQAEKYGVLNDKNFAFQVLYGLGEPIRKTLCQLNLPVYVYTPAGNLMDGMSYFARRILENTSNEGFLFELIEKERGVK